MDKYFYVDSICDNIVRLENINDGSVIEVYSFILPSVSVGNILGLNNGVFYRDDNYKMSREELLRIKLRQAQNN